MLTERRALPVNLHTAEQVRAMDRQLIASAGITGIQLMNRAGNAAFARLLEQWPQPGKITVYCGGGNNGGDGFVIAAIARQRHIPVEVVLLADPARIQGDALLAYEFAKRTGVTFVAFADSELPTEGIVVDAILGTGIKGEVTGAVADAIRRINHAGLPVLAIDMPSGICSDTGCAMGVAVKANATITFIGQKFGLFTGDGLECAGKNIFAPLTEGLVTSTADLEQQVTHCCSLLDLDTLLDQLPARPRHAHKGFYGHVMIIGGDHGMGGAVAMAAEAAGRVGAGLVSVATRAEHVAGVNARRPEVMVHAVASGQELEPLLVRPDVLVIGPGLGRSAWSEQMLQQAAKTGLPMVVDADALNLVAEGRVVSNATRNNWILTPHPGEAARLLQVATATIQANRIAAAQSLQQKFGGVSVLKGAGTLVCSPQRTSLCPAGNPGMASGGMGDVLSGVIGGLLAQGLPLQFVAELGVMLHANAGDKAAAKHGQAGLLATDLMVYLRELINRHSA